MTSSASVWDVVETFYNEDTKTWHGSVVEPKFGEQVSIGSAALEAMRQYPDHIIQICYQSGKQITNREMMQLSIKAARHFKKLEMEQCDMVGLCVANSDFVAPLFFGAMFCGLSLSTTDPSFNANGLKHVYSMTRPKLMFCDGENYQLIREVFDECGLSSCRIYTVRNHIEGIPNIEEFFAEDGDDNGFRVPSLMHGSGQMAMVLCTSGSTGLPKGVKLSHTALLNVTTLGLNFSDRIISFSSLYWALGIFLLIKSATHCITRIISENPFSAEDFFDIVQHYRVNISAHSPAHIPLCLASDKLATSDLSSLRLMIISGKSMPHALIEKFKNVATNCIFRTYYGMTELCGPITSAIVDRNNSVGQLMVNSEVKILNDHSKNLGPNEIGEIMIRTKFPGSGYLNNPEATKAVYVEDGWVRSGDMGYFDNDGQLHIVDRREDILKYNNFHFSPTAIEKVISEIADVAEVCVVGIPDSTYDFLPTAAVIKRPEAQIKESDIYQYVADRMQHFERLHGGVYFFDRLPQTASGKITRNEVMELCQKRRNE